MKNLFDVANYPDEEPDTLVTGYRWVWTRSDITSVYPTATYTLEYHFQSLEDPYPQFEISAGKVASAHVVEEAHTATLDYPPGDYQWTAVIVRDSDSAEQYIDSGYLTVWNSLKDESEQPSWVYRVLVNIRATIEGSASDKQSSYTVAGRSLASRSYGELLELEREFNKRWEREKADRARAAGRTVDRRVLVKMGA